MLFQIWIINFLSFKSLEKIRESIGELPNFDKEFDISLDLWAFWLERAKIGEKKTGLLAYFSTVLVGILYFGPAAHAWCTMIFCLFPKTSLVFTLQKAALGQVIFGPSFTCVFFAASLIQCRNFSLGTWLEKIKSNLFRAWASGLGFWPLVDLVSYSLLPPQWIPLFVNLCLFIWTFYLLLIANKSNQMKVEWVTESN